MIEEHENQETSLQDLIDLVERDDLPTNEFTIQDKDPMVILGKLNEVIAYLQTLQATINASDSKANEALQKAIQAIADATQALSVANGIDAKATQALANAIEAVSTANSALSASNTALSTANTAISTANTALSSANNAVDTAGNALNTAESAETKADTAITTANEAKTTAEGIDTKATTALANSQTAVSTANTAETKAQEAIEQVVAGLGTKVYRDSQLLSSLDIKPIEDDISNNTTAITALQNGKADTSAIPTALSQLSEDTTHRIVTDTEKSTWNAKSDFDGDYNSLTNKPTIPDISGKANLSGGNTFSGTQTFNNGITLANDTAITNASGNNVITTQTGGHTILGDPNGIMNIQGSSVRPLYTRNGGSKALALYKDIPNYFTTAGSTGGNISGGLKLTAGHLYRIYVGMGDAILACLVKMPIPMVEQYWFWGMNLYGHYCRLHISSAGIATYQYANIGQNNWTNNNSIYITYEDITSKS